MADGLTIDGISPEEIKTYKLYRFIKTASYVLFYPKYSTMRADKYDLVEYVPNISAKGRLLWKKNRTVESDLFKKHYSFNELMCRRMPEEEVEKQIQEEHLRKRSWRRVNRQLLRPLFVRTQNIYSDDVVEDTHIRGWLPTGVGVDEYRDIFVENANTGLHNKPILGEDVSNRHQKMRLMAAMKAADRYTKKR